MILSAVGERTTFQISWSGINSTAAHGSNVPNRLATAESSDRASYVLGSSDKFSLIRDVI